MKKIPSLFARNYETDRLVRNEIVPGSRWVAAGEGVATRKFDGTCCRVQGGKLFKRYDAKQGRVPPAGFIPAQDADPVTGHQPGWLEVGWGSDDQWYREAVTSGNPDKVDLPDGTYELCGPKVQGNPEGSATHVLVPHGKEELPDCPRDFEGIKNYLAGRDVEGIVWHHPDGRMVKIKAKDFGIKRSRN
jgi:hypothetical protein